MIEYNEYIELDVNINCKNLGSLTLINCNVNDIHTDNIEHVKLENCYNIDYNDFPNLKNRY